MEGNNLIKKGVAVAVILLFIGVAFAPSTAHNLAEKHPLPTLNGNILYVGGNGSGNYTKIQDAIDDASDGDTVYVFNGTYSDYYPDQLCCVKINKSILLLGENKHTTIINGSGRYDVINIDAYNVSISGFTLQNGGTPGTTLYGRGINLQQEINVTIHDIVLTDNYLGIINYLTTDTLLHNITFIENGKGIEFWDGINCIITYCSFINNGNSIIHSGFGSDSDNSLIIKNNHFINNSRGISTDLFAMDTHGTTFIQHNHFQNNNIAIITYNSKGINILQNNFIQNDYHAKPIRATYFRHFYIYKNHTQNWVNNYWDDWNQNQYYLIKGKWEFYIGGFLHPLFFIHVIDLPYKEYDYDPAQEPYDIGV